MKHRKTILFGLVFLSLIPGLASAQTVDQMTMCNGLLNRQLETEKNEQLVTIILDYKKGTFFFRTEAEKNEYLRRMEALEKEYSVRDPETLREVQRKNIVKYSRQVMADCSDIIGKDGQASTLSTMGKVLTKLKQADDAIPALQRCTAIKPDSAECWFNLGEANESLGRVSEAKFFYKKAIETGAFTELNAIVITSAKLNLFLLEHPGGDSMCAPGEIGLRLQLAQCRDYFDAAPTNGGNTAAAHSFGTGFFVNKEGYILTNNHVIAGCKNLATRDGKPLQVLSRNTRSDLALLKADFTPSSVAIFRSGAAPKLGDAVVAFGFPLPGILSSEGNVSTGVLSATSGLQNDVRFVQISAPVQPGNSGGPLFDSSGHVIGVVVAKLDALQVARATGDVPQNVNFAVHWSEARAFLEEEGIQYRKEPSQRDTSTRNIAANATQIALTIDCAQ